MLAAPNLPKLSRNWPLVVIAGAAGCALGIAVFTLCGTAWIVAALTKASAPIGALMVAAVWLRRCGRRRIVCQQPPAPTDAVVPRCAQ